MLFVRVMPPLRVILNDRIVRNRSLKGIEPRAPMVGENAITAVALTNPLITLRSTTATKNRQTDADDSIRL
jgi:hypothetical protein